MTFDQATGYLRGTIIGQSRGVYTAAGAVADRGLRHMVSEDTAEFFAMGTVDGALESPSDVAAKRAEVATTVRAAGFALMRAEERARFPMFESVEAP